MRCCNTAAKSCTVRMPSTLPPSGLRAGEASQSRSPTDADKPSNFRVREADPALRDQLMPLPKPRTPELVKDDPKDQKDRTCGPAGASVSMNVVVGVPSMNCLKSSHRSS